MRLRLLVLSLVAFSFGCARSPRLETTPVGDGAFDVIIENGKVVDGTVHGQVAYVPTRKKHRANHK